MAYVGPELTAVSFKLYTPDEIRSMSVLEIKTSLCFNALGHALKGGLYDLALGPSGSASGNVCDTCKQTERHCPGHFGHIELPLPVVNPLFYKEICLLVSSSCRNCFRIMINPVYKHLLVYQLKLLDSGYVTEPQEIEIIALNVNDENAKSDAVGLIVRDKILEYLEENKIDLTRTSKTTKTTESLRRQFIAKALSEVTKPKICPHCKNVMRKVTSFQNVLLTSVTKVEIADKFKEISDNKRSKQETVMILPKESRTILRNLWQSESDLIETLFPVLKEAEVAYPTDLLYMEVLLVTPPKIRPLNFVNGQMLESEQTRAYKAIINNCIVVKNVIKAVQTDSFDSLTPECKAYVNSIKGATPTDKLHQCWIELQSDVDHLLDANTNKATSSLGIIGLKQRIEKKCGILRMHMMGKRVNFAARSVITPDPNLQIEEIGIPEDFAKKLTYPVKVTYRNVEELRKMVINGPDKHPGAIFVEYDSGPFKRLPSGENALIHRQGIAKRLLEDVKNGKGRTVHRHLQNGDMLLLNRQPTLHRPSIMAHRAKILKNEKTLRMHYSNCKSYNADFDGDEMNAHFPQNEIAQSEANHIVNVASHYLVPKDGTPLGGLIQDHIIAGVKLTIRGEFFDKYDYQHLVFQGLPHKTGNFKLLPPCMLKPKTLWSGKQIISTILMNIIPDDKELISLTSRAKIGAKSWITGESRLVLNDMCESQVLLRNGELICGVLDKQQYGPTPYGLVHCLYELYGGHVSSRFLDALGKLFTAYLQLTGFTIGVQDILVNAEADRNRMNVIRTIRRLGDLAASRAFGLEDIPEDIDDRLEKEYYKDAKFKNKLDQEYKELLDNLTNEVNSMCQNEGLISKFPHNNLQLMIISGAKGSMVNSMQISCQLGQIELEGKRPPWMVSGRSLPSFKPYETSPCAGGYVDGRFLTGITPQDFFFHCMAGREGLIDTAVKTSRSGYLQRCLIKHLEGVKVCYDGTVRDHDGSVIQFAYGEDGMEVGKAAFLNETCMNILYENRKTIVNESICSKLEDVAKSEEIEAYRLQIEENRDSIKRRQPFTNYSVSLKLRLIEKKGEECFRDFDPATGRSRAYKTASKYWQKFSEERRLKYKNDPVPDPITSKYLPYRDFYAISENMERLIRDYEADNKESLRKLISLKYMTALCAPGDPVGLLAAQSVGEPSTQMTLNTFHFAGRGEMNVTLGIPRLREILMTASENIKTPNMEIPLLMGNKRMSDEADRKALKKRARKLRKIFRRVTVADVLEKITVDERLSPSTKVLNYTVKFHFLPSFCYKKEFLVKPPQILKYMEQEFMKTLSREIRHIGKRSGDVIHESKAEKEPKEKPDEEIDDIDAAAVELTRKRQNDESSDDDELDDDDATKERSRNRRQDEIEYDEPEESEAEISDEEAETEEIENVELTENMKQEAEDRQKTVLSFPLVKEYRYDVIREEWCEFVIAVNLTLSRIDFSTLLRELCEKSVIYQVPGIKRAITDEKGGSFVIKTEGINLIEAFKYSEMLDLNKLYSNDVHRMAKTYGIEAAGKVIVKELKDVFGAYGIGVDPRHLILISDYMTQQGVYTPFNRTGIQDGSSPFQQMTFESSINFLKSAVIKTKTDELQGPSSRIVVGRYCNTGTGCFDVINKTELL